MAYIGVMIARAVGRLVASDNTPTMNGASADNARTIDRIADARPRNSPGTTSDISASLGATGMVMQRLPRNSSVRGERELVSEERR